jgi:two-component system NtrC family response regulator
VRELLSAVRRAAIMADGNRVAAADLGLEDAPTEAAAGAAGGTAGDLDLRAVREAAERQAVLAALARTDSNIAKASELLGVSRPTLYDLMNRLAIRQHTNP